MRTLTIQTWPKQQLGQPGLFKRFNQTAQDGFICTAQQYNHIPLSLLIDDIGLYFDAAQPSRLEQLIARQQDLPEDNYATVQNIIKRIVEHGISRYNPLFQPLPAALQSLPTRPRVLVLDQPVGSRIVLLGLANAASFKQMLRAAITENPDTEIWVKSATSPTGKIQRGYLAQLPAGVQRINLSVNPYQLFTQFTRVYTVTSHLGFEALLAGLPVRVFGMPYYAGWGLTEDQLMLPRRQAKPSLVAVFAAAYLDYPHYLNPATHAAGTLNEVLDCIQLQHQIRQRLAPLGKLVGLGFQRWKRRFAEPYLSASGHAVRWRSRSYRLVAGEQAVLWGATPQPAHINGSVLRMEDAFIHSHGLGSDLIAPCSQALDCQGLYFNSRQSNDLLDICNQYEFTAELCQRAADLRKHIQQLGITKYNLGRRAPGWQPPVKQRVILIPGQVANDAAIRFGSGAINTAEGLLQVVRALNPDAYLVYKPHPDVLSGNRAGLISAHKLCDRVDTTADILSLLEICDEVHTLSSLAGFDALLRGKVVYTYGLPFYAGWGLTQDAMAPVSGRQRKLSLDQLTAAVLILYPVYWDWSLGVFTTPEATIKQLALPASRPLTAINHQWLRPFIKTGRWLNNVAHRR